MVNNNVDWRKVLVKIAGNISTELNLNILVEDFILQEISDRIDNSLDHIEFEIYRNCNEKENNRDTGFLCA